MFALTDQVAIITGGAKGIGKGIAKTMIEADATVVITDVDEGGVREAAEELGVEFEVLDVSSKSSCQRAVKAIQDLNKVHH